VSSSILIDTQLRRDDRVVRGGGWRPTAEVWDGELNSSLGTFVMRRCVPLIHAWALAHGSILVGATPRRSTSSLGSMRASSLLLIAACLAMVACVPMRIIDRPGATGKVVDSLSAAPIYGARVTLALDGHRADARVASATTDVDGRFAIPAVHTWIIYVVPMDFMAYLGHLRVESAGYASASLALQSSPKGPGTIDYGTIPVSRLQ